MTCCPTRHFPFPKIEGRHGTYALIDKGGENRDKEIRKPRPSIRAQLKTDNFSRKWQKYNILDKKS